MLTPEQQALGNRSVREMLDYLRGLVAYRRQHLGDPEHDVLTRLIQGESSGDRLSDVELLQNCIFLLNAGHETTTNLIGNALLSRQEWPAQRVWLQQRLHQQRDGAETREQTLAVAVDEFLRRALKLCEVGGVALPEGALVTLCIGAANRDPAQFEQPEVLDLARQNNKHLAFGFGVHQCAGLSLARLEGRIAIGRFLRRFPGYPLSACRSQSPGCCGSGARCRSESSWPGTPRPAPLA